MPFKFSIPLFPLLQLYTPLILRNRMETIQLSIQFFQTSQHSIKIAQFERNTNITERCTIRRALSPINRVSRVLSREKCGSVAFANEPY